MVFMHFHQVLHMTAYRTYVFLYCMYVILLQHGEVDLVGLKPNTLDPIFFQCFDTVGWVVGSLI